MNSTLMPTKPGQICKIISDLADHEPDEVYIITEDPQDFDDQDEILVVSLTELQRNVNNTDQAERISVRKDKLVFVAEDIQEYVSSWNAK